MHASASKRLPPAIFIYRAAARRDSTRRQSSEHFFEAFRHASWIIFDIVTGIINTFISLWRSTRFISLPPAIHSAPAFDREVSLAKYKLTAPLRYHGCAYIRRAHISGHIRWPTFLSNTRHTFLSGAGHY